MQTLPAYRVHTLQVDEGCTASRDLTETMLSPNSAPCNRERPKDWSGELQIGPPPYTS